MANTRRQVLLSAGAAGLLAGDAAAQPARPTNEQPESERFRQAVVTGDLATVVSFLDKDPALRYARNNDGVSVYTLACLKGQTKVAEELQRRGLVLDAFEAAAGGNSQRAAELAKEDPGIARHRLPDGRTPLHIAVEAGRTDLAIFFGTRGADLNSGPESPLLAAVDHPNPAAALDIGRFLLGNASDPNARRKDGQTALHVAAARGYGEITELLIHRGADVSARDANGRSPLEVASGDAIAALRREGSVERVYFGRRFTQNLTGAAPEKQDTSSIPQDLINQFVTLSHFDFESVRKLQKMCPALVMTRATFDEMPIEAASHMGLVPMARFFADLGAPVSTCTATLLGAAGLVKKLTRDDPACVRERGAHDIALLAYTAYGDQQTEIAETLVNAGAGVRERALGQTILHIAAAKGYLELAELLLNRGADLNATAKIRGAFLTPTAYAVQAKQQKMADFLKSRGGRA